MGLTMDKRNFEYEVYGRIVDMKLEVQRSTLVFDDVYEFHEDMYRIYWDIMKTKAQQETSYDINK